MYLQLYVLAPPKKTIDHESYVVKEPECRKQLQNVNHFIVQTMRTT